MTIEDAIATFVSDQVTAEIQEFDVTDFDNFETAVNRVIEGFDVTDMDSFDSAVNSALEAFDVTDFDNFEYEVRSIVAGFDPSDLYDFETAVRNALSIGLYDTVNTDVDGENALEAVEEALYEFPDRRTERCSLGRNFTSAVESVISDDETIDLILREVFKAMKDPVRIARILEEIED